MRFKELHKHRVGGTESWHAYLYVTCACFPSTLPPFLSCHALHPLLIQPLKISFPTQLAFSPSECRRLWCVFFFFFSPPFILCERFLFHSPIKIIIEVTEKEFWSFTGENILKGILAGPLGRCWSPRLLPRRGYQCYWEPLIHSFARSFFNYICSERFHCSTARPCCCYLFFCETLDCRACKMRTLIIFTLRQVTT